MSMVEVLLRKAISSTVHIALASDRQTPPVIIILCLLLYPADFRTNTSLAKYVLIRKYRAQN